MLDLLKQAGPSGYLCIGGGAVGLFLSIVTLALTAAKSDAAKVTGVLCLLCALGVLAIGAGGYQLGMVATMRSLPNVPDDMKDLLLRKGTEEARSNYTLALAAAGLPLLAGLLAVLLSRFRVGIAFAALAAVAWGATLVQLARPLPPTEPKLAAPPGLQLPHSVARQVLRTWALVALTPDGVWTDGQKVSTMAQALDHPTVRERNSTTLPLMVDERVPFSALLAVLEAAQGAGRTTFHLVVLSRGGEHRVLPIATGKDEPTPAGVRPPLLLTLHVHADKLSIGATGGSLPPVATPEELNKKLGEIKASFPDQADIRITADAEVPVGKLVEALDASREKDDKVLFPGLVVGRFTLPKGEQE